MVYLRNISMKKYGQFCPLAQAAQILCERWTLIIVRELIAGSTRYSELKKGVPMMSPTLLSTRLKQLVNAGIITSNRKGLYLLTQAGNELRPIIELFGSWGHRWARSNLDNDDLDASLLMWDMRRTIDPEVFPNNRVVIHFNFFDAATGELDWWLISENEVVDLCHDDKGYDIDIFIQCSLSTMTSVGTCQSTFNDEVKKGKINVYGSTTLTKNLQEWLKSSLLSRLGTVNKMPKLTWEID